MDDKTGGVAERRDEAYEFDEKLTVVGAQLRPGDLAPAFRLSAFDAESGEMRDVQLADSAGEVRLLNVVNSLDTPVCQVETRRWEQLRGDLPEGVRVYTISMDLPFAQARWRQAEGVAHEALSAHADEGFGAAYGVLLKEWRLLQRAVFVVEGDGTVVHAEYVADQMTEPDYGAAVAAAGSA